MCLSFANSIILPLFRHPSALIHTLCPLLLSPSLFPSCFLTKSRLPFLHPLVSRRSSRASPWTARTDAGLFARVILMSGSNLAPATLATEAELFSATLAKGAGCDASADPAILLQCLRTKDAQQLVKVGVGAVDGVAGQTAFGPIVDGLLVPSDPLSVMQSDNGSSAFAGSPRTSARPHDLLIGVTSMEAPASLTQTEAGGGGGIDVGRRNRILYDVMRRLTDHAHQDLVLMTLVNEYTEGVSENSTQRLRSLMELLSDGLVVAPVAKTTLLQRRHQQRVNSDQRRPASEAAKVFSYVFAHQVRCSTLVLATHPAIASRPSLQSWSSADMLCADAATLL